MASTSSPRRVYSTACVVGLSRRIWRKKRFESSWTNCNLSFLRSGEVKLTSLHSKVTTGVFDMW